TTGIPINHAVYDESIVGNKTHPAKLVANHVLLPKPNLSPHRNQTRQSAADSQNSPAHHPLGPRHGPRNRRRPWCEFFLLRFRKGEEALRARTQPGNGRACRKRTPPLEPRCRVSRPPRRANSIIR